MNLKGFLKFWTVFWLIFSISCSENKYSDLVKKELASGVIHDSLFLGLRLGQSRKDFFEICWDLNREKKVTHSELFPFVKYPLPKKKSLEAENDITMLFYGDFNREKTVMTGIQLQFYYEAWALWNEAVQSDKLLLAVKDSLEKWYPGNDFLELKKDSLQFFVKVDGNRRITIKPLDDNRIVKAKIDDLRYVLDEK
ncbi:hypothetical protein [Ulvibacterium sp.]|uniref:hypothetical protein n=1 Tax=Ulvibacterium sp. TaxID=2665914 RepID=UPI002604D61B|nr:hypothetical protein [Ulvibacterium sp.]